MATAHEDIHEYGISLVAWSNLPGADAIVAAISHQEYLAMPQTDLLAKLKPGRVLVDVKSAYDSVAIVAAGYKLWRL